MRRRRLRKHLRHVCQRQNLRRHGQVHHRGQVRCQRLPVATRKLQQLRRGLRVCRHDPSLPQQRVLHEAMQRQAMRQRRLQRRLRRVRDGPELQRERPMYRQYLVRRRYVSEQRELHVVSPRLRVRWRRRQLSVRGMLRSQLQRRDVRRGQLRPKLRKLRVGVSLHERELPGQLRRRHPGGGRKLQHLPAGRAMSERIHLCQLRLLSRSAVRYRLAMRVRHGMRHDGRLRRVPLRGNVQLRHPPVLRCLWRWCYSGSAPVVTGGSVLQRQRRERQPASFDDGRERRHHRRCWRYHHLHAVARATVGRRSSEPFPPARGTYA